MIIKNSHGKKKNMRSCTFNTATSDNNMATSDTKRAQQPHGYHAPKYEKIKE